MDRDTESLERRIRRLQKLEKDNLFRGVNGTLREVWQEGKQPAALRLRHNFVIDKVDVDRQPPASRLLNPRGIALRFYLLALFEAQCRLDPGAEWTGDRTFRGRHGWKDFVAIDVGYNSATGTYTWAPPRAQETKRIRQVKGALCTLEDLGDQALVEIPRKKGGHRDHRAFRLMRETGRGTALAADYYVVPTADDTVIEVPINFFLQGWVQVLYPSEIFTWLSLRFLRLKFPGEHQESGNYLYAKKREYFHLLRDSYEDSCQTLVELGLIRRMPTAAERSAPAPGTFESLFQQPRQPGGRADRYEPYRYQLIDEGLAVDALEKCMRELVLRQNGKD
ncbi:hypothetical protein [Streptomyces tirandamycinicus]|uniref:Uncharacterized protein n=1 Tax=Streptomyces tirandamycinicus TaxID=2174846 RepID=A0A2S1T2A8_9ACTN|nr:hypothetical protein [Streptomyces tirandamycinicus]AWI32781.1 hypothetical protein DDW44_31205 [Streptomyces tirandamycinicus]